MIKLIEYFSKRHLLTNFLMLGIFIGGIFFWHKTGKEEMPDLTMDMLRISVSYPGASPQEVEYFISAVSVFGAFQSGKGKNGLVLYGWQDDSGLIHVR